MGCSHRPLTAASQLSRGLVRCRSAAAIHDQRDGRIQPPVEMSALDSLRTLASSAKLRLMGNDNPSERDVGARIRVKGEFADEAASAFDREGLNPLYIERRADGDVSFWFSKLGEADLLKACEAIPREWYAVSGNIR
jgi:hypothetical protein